MIRPCTHNNELIPLAHSELSTFTGSQHHTTSYLAIHNQRQGDRKPVYQHGNSHKPPIITPISCPRYLHWGTLQAQVNITRNISMKHWKGHGHHRNDRRLCHARAHSGTVSQSLHNGLRKNLSSICTWIVTQHLLCKFNPHRWVLLTACRLAFGSGHKYHVTWPTGQVTAIVTMSSKLSPLR